MNTLLTTSVQRTLAALCVPAAAVVCGANGAPCACGVCAEMMNSPETECQIIFS